MHLNRVFCSLPVGKCSWYLIVAVRVAGRMQKEVTMKRGQIDTLNSKLLWLEETLQNMNAVWCLHKILDSAYYTRYKRYKLFCFSFISIVKSVYDLNASAEEDFTRRERHVVRDGQETDVTESESDVRGTKLRHDKHGSQEQGVAAGSSTGKGTGTFIGIMEYICSTSEVKLPLNGQIIRKLPFKGVNVFVLFCIVLASSQGQDWSWKIPGTSELWISRKRYRLMLWSRK